MQVEETVPLLERGLEPKRPASRINWAVCVPTVALFLLLGYNVYVWTANPVHQRLSSLHAADGFLGQVILPWDSDFKGYARQWNEVGNLQTPAAVVLPTTEEDISLITRVVKELKVPYTVKSGGHSFGGFSSNSHGVVVSMQNMAKVVLDEASETVTAQAGARSIDVVKAVQPKGYAVVSGGCPQVAVGGYIQGGGLGFYSRAHGLAIDNLISARIVLPNGTAITTSKNSAPDLFWAIRGGGGGNWGIITEFKFKAFKSPDLQTFGSFNIKATDLEAFGNWLVGVAPSLPREFNLMIEGGMGGPIGVQVIWLRSPGETDNGVQWIKDNILAKLPVPYTDFKIKQQSYLQFIASQPPLDGQLVSGPSGFISDKVPEKQIKVLSEVFTKLTAKYPNNFLLDIELWGGAISETPATETAFPWRNALLNTAIWAFVPKDQDKLFQQIQMDIAKVEPLFRDSLMGNYVNYIDTSLSDDLFGPLYYGQNLPKLVEVKRRYDPSGLFKFKQSVEL